MLCKLKAFIDRKWTVYEEDPGQGFDVPLHWSVEYVGYRKENAKGRYRHAE